MKKMASAGADLLWQLCPVQEGLGCAKGFLKMCVCACVASAKVAGRAEGVQQRERILLQNAKPFSPSLQPPLHGRNGAVGWSVFGACL